AAAPAPAGPSAVRLWIGAGRRDEIAAGDVMGALVRSGGLARESIGRIDIRESFTLVELGAGVDAEAVAEKVTGRTIGKRRLVARVDRGRPGGRARPGMPPRPPR
ncbi:MAG: DbpA RNA binding domain-containing protein, partial [Gemmatimonadales bacterium]